MGKEAGRGWRCGPNAIFYCPRAEVTADWRIKANS